MPTIDVAGANSQVMEMFSSHRDLTSLAVLEDDKPIGLINRTIFLSQMSKPFHRELYDKKSCIAFMDKEPLIVDAAMSIEALTFKTVEFGEKTLADGFIITREGRFLGLGSGLQLMGVVAAMQAEKNRQIMQSIEYASVIQRAMLRASRETLALTLRDAALVWEPRDVVGGDFYHFATHDDGWFGAVADCTGHGVPGAFMTLIASSSLSKALEHLGPRNPAALLASVNRTVKGLLGQVNGIDDTPESDDGLDAAFFWFDTQRSELTFAGARIALHILRPDADQFDTLAGQRMGVGYVDSHANYEWTQNTVAVTPASILFIATDGLTDQIGGPRKIGFGKRQTCDVILAHRSEPASVICEQLRQTLATWQATQSRRDDLTLFCARIQDNL
ncbi:SpoIIE family protein phosphatase [Pseudomonas sp. CCI3.2]|uniref:SpoIIE family protein phosphatase n=1 Tax=unclassified Pseudomonas TaxID=196821 RepID=UPI002AC9B376|nr:MULTISPECIES: SpoIIE family protein phosphatase [unclassified Pseudomonas]MEB0076610.1 SpoIIE family protein phosphatase [Pseudomonas sp. MH10out]MEB0100698.1 SpoIIE family protein phosphatase [Pseudomonas sp. CCI3.2]MEB0130313.1 SpoIIE family protein phosphatase [Pseudomonas sp. CCI2.4]MEB0158841.1 SpoIIE family protein phosphatase [Pseudomonas sp. AH2 (2023)]MEB0169320.1 SpoIIE family protein phosphatase [Pseudomonas sp. CCC4.4]